MRVPKISDEVDEKFADCDLDVVKRIKSFVLNALTNKDIDEELKIINALDAEDERVLEKLNVKLKDAGFTNRTYNALLTSVFYCQRPFVDHSDEDAQKLSLYDLIRGGRKQVMRGRNMGPTTLADIDKVLNEHGMSFAMDLSRFEAFFRKYK